MLWAGTQTLTAAFTPTDATDYNTANASVTLTVNQAPLTVTAANLSRPYNTANPSLTWTLSGWVNGDTSRLSAAVRT